MKTFCGFQNIRFSHSNKRHCLWLQSLCAWYWWRLNIVLIRQMVYGEISVVYLIDVAHPFKTGLDDQTWQAYIYASVNQVISGSAYV